MNLKDVKTRQEAMEWAKAQRQPEYLALVNRIPATEKIVSGCAKLLPRKAKVGDIFFHIAFGHPFVAISKKLGVDEFWCVGLSTKEMHSIGVLNSRYTANSFLTTVLATCADEVICKNYRGSVPTQEVRRIKTLIKKQLPKL